MARSKSRGSPARSTCHSSAGLRVLGRFIATLIFYIKNQCAESPFEHEARLQETSALAFSSALAKAQENSTGLNAGEKKKKKNC